MASRDPKFYKFADRAPHILCISRTSDRRSALYPACLHVWVNHSRETLVSSFHQWTETCHVQSELHKLYPHLHPYQLSRTARESPKMGTVGRKFSVKGDLWSALAERHVGCYLSLYRLGGSSFCSNKCFYYNSLKLILIYNILTFSKAITENLKW